MVALNSNHDDPHANVRANMRACAIQSQANLKACLETFGTIRALCDRAKAVDELRCEVAETHLALLLQLLEARAAIDRLLSGDSAPAMNEANEQNP